MKNHQNWTKIVKETCFLKVFRILFNLGQILVLFWHPRHPWARDKSGDIIDLRFVFDFFVPQRHLAIFFTLFKLKPDITCIDLTSIKSDNITFYSHNGWIDKVVQAVSVVIWNESELELKFFKCRETTLVFIVCVQGLQSAQVNSYGLLWTRTTSMQSKGVSPALFTQ